MEHCEFWQLSAKHEWCELGELECNCRGRSKSCSLHSRHAAAEDAESDPREKPVALKPHRRRSIRRAA